MTELVVNGHTYTDDSDPATGLGNGGHKTRLLPMLSDSMVEITNRSTVVGGGAFGALYTLNLASQADSDPGAGLLKFNHATPASATTIFVDLVDAGGSTVTALLDALDDSTSTVKGVLTVRALTSANVWLQFTVSAVTTVAGYRKIVCAYLAGPGGFTDATNVLLAFAPKGDKGDTGSTADIHGQSELTAPATADELLIADASAAYAVLRITLANLLKVVASLTAKTTPIGADGVLLIDSAASNAATVATVAQLFKGVASLTAKSTPVGADGLLLIDSAASNAAKLVTRAQLLAGRHTVCIPAASLIPATTNGCAAVAQAESATNKINRRYLAFDAASVEYAWAMFRVPKGWKADGFYIDFLWEHPSTSTNFGVVWQAEVLFRADGEAIDTAVGTAQTVTDTGGNTAYVYISSLSSQVVPSGTLGKAGVVFVRVARLATNGSDTMTVDAYLLDATLRYDTDAADDT